MFQRLWFFVVVLLSIQFACGGEKNNLKVEQIPPELSFTSFSSSLPVLYRGETFRDTVYLIDFWATWCAPCIESIPHMDSLIEQYRRKKVKFISITYEPRKRVELFLREHPMSSIIGLDNDFTIFRKYNA